MKAALLFALRLTTGMLLIIWGSVKIFAGEQALRISDNFYGGLLSFESLLPLLGIAQMALGALVIVGFYRSITYVAQAVVLVGGAFAVWRYILDPLGLYLLTEETRQLLFFPSSTIAVASLILLAFKAEDRFSLDVYLSKRTGRAEAQPA